MSKKTEAKTYRPPVLNRDHARPRNQPAVSNAEVEAQIADLVGPATLALTSYYHSLGLRARILTLPITVALVLALIWRQIPSVSELARLVSRERLLWAPLLDISQQAVSLRLRCLPDDLFARILHEILPRLQERTRARSRPLPPVIQRTLARFGAIRIIDATTLEELFRKVGGLRDAPTAPLAGKLCGLLDLPSKLPVQLWLDPNPSANEKSFLDRLKPFLPPGTLVLFDRGFYAFPFFDWLTEHHVAFVSRARELGADPITQFLTETATVRDCLIQLGQYRSNPCTHPVRLIEVQVGGVWHRYLTNVLDPTVLPTSDVVALYGYRWRIEEAFLLTKRLLGLAYLWTGAFNGVCLQVWATWLLYGVLVDLSDAIAQELTLPLERISLEMVYRGLYHFTVAFNKAQAHDPVVYLAAQTDLGIVKRRRKYRERDRLDKMPPDLNL
jgi:Transposase DDE domain